MGQYICCSNDQFVQDGRRPFLLLYSFMRKRIQWLYIQCLIAHKFTNECTAMI